MPGALFLSQPFVSNLVEGSAIAVEDCIFPRQRLPAPHHHIHIFRIKLDAAAMALRLFGSGQRGSAAQERLVYFGAREKLPGYAHEKLTT